MMESLNPVGLIERFGAIVVGLIILVVALAVGLGVALYVLLF